MHSKIFRRSLFLLLFSQLACSPIEKATGQTGMKIAETVIMPSAATFSGWWGNAINMANSASGAVFTDKTDGSQWICFAEDNGLPTASPNLSVAHVVNGIVTVSHKTLPVFSTTDQHNACSIALDNSGFIHLTYDQHATALHYFKSLHPRDMFSWSGPLSMLGGTIETQVTFVLLFTNPVSGELYCSFQNPGGAGGQQFLYHYNTSTGWEAAAGTASLGRLANYVPGGAGATFVSGLPQWDKTTGFLWFAYNVSEASVPNWNCGGDPGSPCGWYLLGWNGTSFIKWDGTAQSLPLTLSNSTPWFTVNAGAAPCFSVLDSTSIDANGTLFIPYIDCDASNFLQVYVLSCPHQATCTRHQLTANNSLFTPPGPAGWLGISTWACSSAPYSCGEYVQSPLSVSSGTCTWITYPDIFNWGSGQIAFKSCDNFQTSSSSYITTRFNPNGGTYPDQVANYTRGTISFLFTYANDTQFRFSTMVSSSTTDVGKIWLMTMDPGSVAASGGVTLSGGMTMQ